MAGYLRKYVGIYEVRADYDEDTNDFPRQIDGTLDPSFDDYYISCQNDIKIRHATGSILSCYIPSLIRGQNILKQIKEQGCQVIECDILDSEVYFTFPASDIEVVAECCKARTKGRNIQPLSPKTLPKRKAKDVIPDDELKRYKLAFNKLDGEKPFEKAQKLRAINKDFESKLKKDWKVEARSLKLDFRGYIWHIGKWDEYLSTIKENVAP